MIEGFIACCGPRVLRPFLPRTQAKPPSHRTSVHSHLCELNTTASIVILISSHLYFECCALCRESPCHVPGHGLTHTLSRYLHTAALQNEVQPKNLEREITVLRTQVSIPLPLKISKLPLKCNVKNVTLNLNPRYRPVHQRHSMQIEPSIYRY
ncbi:hypothetical protein NA56DRAFT_383252 [Hyaloscypha hepaticicola]|uniref:Uncharacterized protein n=1 Tax=Hyaloscypha hepaticicola TaxID=2082293 RepID=A0A2J6QHF9_9HELO|nr:hypothetical protein NA56DRAFT_383252 [Hyaloscypha hepaticicola]